MTYLFDKHTMEERLEMHNETLCCWLRSVMEAKSLQEISEAGLRRDAALFSPNITHHTFLYQLSALVSSDDSIFSKLDWEPD
jgi:hypothetical protein